MMKLAIVTLLTSLALSAQTPVDQIAAVLNDWHKAAASADEPRYFAHFAPNGVFIGTDGSERWTVNEFRKWAAPHFQTKKTWDFKPRDRHVDLSPDGTIAWFDEMLDTTNLGICRGSGVLIRSAGQWKIAQYNLSIPIPNAKVNSIVSEIAGGIAGKVK